MRVLAARNIKPRCSTTDHLPFSLILTTPDRRERRRRIRRSQVSARTVMPASRRSRPCGSTPGGVSKLIQDCEGSHVLPSLALKRKDRLPRATFGAGRLRNWQGSEGRVEGSAGRRWERSAPYGGCKRLACRNAADAARHSLDTGSLEARWAARCRPPAQSSPAMGPSRGLALAAVLVRLWYFVQRVREAG